MKLLAIVSVLFGFGVASINAQECDPLDLSSISLAVPNSLVGELRRSVEQAQQPAAETIVIGDSIVRRWPSNIFNNLFEGGVANFGLEGDKVQNLMWRLSDIANLQPTPRRVVIWIGTNNISASDKPCAIKAALLNVIGNAREIWPVSLLVVMGIAPRGNDFQWREAWRLEINDELRLRQLEMGYRYIDTSSLRCGVKTGVFDFESSAMQCPNYLPDHLHLAEPGYRHLAAVLNQI